MTQQTPSTNGVILHEDAERVIIATGLQASSKNSKTGGMVQLYILVRDVSPLDAVKSGADAAICGDCQHRGAIVDGKLVGRRCYVNLGQGPRSVWQAYQNGRYRHALLAEYPALFGGRAIRLGAYGDPAFMPRAIVAELTRVASFHTGYTHQWRSNRWLQPFVMASCDSPAEAISAASTGWRTFRVARRGDTAKLQHEISCPASAEGGKRTTCENCGLCDGSREMRDARKNIVIQDHSMIATTRPMGLIQIGA
jgi:hypothetical protein